MEPSTVFARYKSGSELSPRSRFLWRVAQTAVWLVGAVIFFCLIFYPAIGIMLFWNILIPIAPALIVVAVGLWRNICPLATTTLLPRRLGLSKRKIMSFSLQGKLGLVAVIALYALVPLRHPLFNVSGLATAILIAGVTVLGITMGFFYEWKSAWCSTLCPIHPVEKLYGSNVLASLPNAHCDECMKCVIPCPDSTPNVHANASQKTSYDRLSGFLIVGGLPGFIWGWFHDPDYNTGFVGSTPFDVYKMPLAGMAVTIGLFWLLTSIFHEKHDKTLTGIFAASAISCYYWYRIPALLGFGKYAGDGLLIDVSNFLPGWTMVLTVLATTIFFFWWLVFREPNRSSWVIRPAYSK